MVKQTKQRILVTGGGGYIGFHIGVRLLQLGHDVTLYDLRVPSHEWDPNLKSHVGYGGDRETELLSCSAGKMLFFKGDVRDPVAMKKATMDAACVIHTASYGMSGREQMPPYFDKVEDVNINGTKNVIEACVLNKCLGLVYTSTYNVVFGGKPILGGDETLPYFPLHRHVDHYSRTKSIAEQLVLTSNGRGQLQTCALRLAGVIGKGESRHLPRVIGPISKGLVKFNYFDEHGGLVDFIGLENVVEGHVKAAEKILSGSKIGGEAFFLSDGKPINNLQYFKPIFDHFEQSFPTLRLPMWLMYILVFTVHFLYSLVYRFFDFTPFLTPAELYKTGVTHYFSIDKARKQLDYEPVKQNDLSDVIISLTEKSTGQNSDI